MSHLDEGQLNALLDGELDEAERKAAEAHLESCAECRREFTEARALMAGADDLIAAVALPARSGPAAVAPKPKPAAFRWRNVVWAASLMFAVGLGWLARADDRYLADSARLAKDGEASAASATPEPAPAPASIARPGSAPVEERTKSEPANGNLASRIGSVDQKATQPTAPPRQGESAKTAMGLSDSPAKPEAAAPVVAEQPAPVATTDAVRALTNPADKPADDAGKAAAGSAERQLASKTARDERSDPLAAGNVATSQSIAKAAKESVVNGFAAPGRAPAPVPEGRRAREAGAFRATPMEEVVRILGGSIRLVDGMTPTHVMVGPGALVSGADPGLEIVRVVYNDPPGRELWLDQQRPVNGVAEADRQGPVATTLLPGDTLVVVYKTGERGLRWIHQSGFRLGLTGFLPADSLRALARRVQ